MNKPVNKRAIKILPLAVAVIACLATASVAAQEPQTSVKIELIILKNKVSESLQERLFEMPKRSDDTIGAAMELFTTTGSANKSRVRPTVNYTMESEYRKLIRSKEFEVLHRIAWMQPRYDREEAIPISLLPEQRSDLVKAVAQVAYNRLYRLKLDMLYAYPGGGTEQAIPEHRTLLIRMSKVMTDKKIYYLDHPLLSVLVRIIERSPPPRRDRISQ